MLLDGEALVSLSSSPFFFLLISVTPPHLLWKGSGGDDDVDDDDGDDNDDDDDSWQFWGLNSGPWHGQLALHYLPLLSLLITVGWFTVLQA